MRTFTLAITAVLAILLLAVGAAAAHGMNSSAADHDTGPHNGTAAGWATWMEQHMTEQMGAQTAAQVQDRAGMSHEEMDEYMASHRNGSTMNGMMHGGMSGMDCH